MEQDAKKPTPLERTDVCLWLMFFGLGLLLGFQLAA